jgi:hypothetical protein
MTKLENPRPIFGVPAGPNQCFQYAPGTGPTVIWTLHKYPGQEGSIAEEFVDTTIYRTGDGSAVGSIRQNPLPRAKTLRPAMVFDQQGKFFWSIHWTMDGNSQNVHASVYDTANWRLVETIIAPMYDTDLLGFNHTADHKMFPAFSEDGSQLALDLWSSIYLFKRNSAGSWADKPRRIRKTKEPSDYEEPPNPDLTVKYLKFCKIGTTDVLVAYGLDTSSPRRPRAVIRVWGATTGVRMAHWDIEVGRYTLPGSGVMANKHFKLKEPPARIATLAPDKLIVWKLLLESPRSSGLFTLDLTTKVFTPIKGITIAKPDPSCCHHVFSKLDSSEKRGWISITQCVGKRIGHSPEIVTEIWDLATGRLLRSFRDMCLASEMWFGDEMTLCSSKRDDPDYHYLRKPTVDSPAFSVWRILDGDMERL